jgi:hypothetical protein
MSDPIGEFSLQHTGNTYGTNSAGDMTSSAIFKVKRPALAWYGAH